MMLPTHALSGMALAAPVAVVSPEFAGVAFLAGLLGGVVPDLDMYAGHRKTLHYPVYYTIAAVVATLLAAVVPTTVTVAAAVFLAGAALHSVTDVFGSGLELRPWEGTSDRAVYDHARGQWIEPRRLIRYDGSPEDFLLSVGLAVPLLATLEGGFRTVILAALAVGFVYTAVRRTLPTIATVLLAYVPTALREYVPARYLADDGRAARVG
ncbi:metal-dependent hydrolase [Natrialbaceae archaeon AArc-T1-2]|uniref:metal-dependent hydrolase n=1 Tax=Natrialbaceae archaeon AArc-T1-2 TaxID=3053904 RepID=UPI00255B2650|nr:metal-dependent hydrolase [Natrialbaceae archaeon AArc-T1-2]WIV65756.1 metal-dependent hydrolase [Natrialbaceae archaeon AArc-T1-2]